MTYLDLARAALSHRERSEKSPTTTSSSLCLAITAGEISEGSEKSPAADSGWLAPEDAERLKAQIIAAVAVEPADFDRARYETLLSRWNAHAAALVRPSAGDQVA